MLIICRWWTGAPVIILRYSGQRLQVPLIALLLELIQPPLNTHKSIDDERMLPWSSLDVASSDFRCPWSLFHWSHLEPPWKKLLRPNYPVSQKPRLRPIPPESDQTNRCSAIQESLSDPTDPTLDPTDRTVERDDLSWLSLAPYYFVWSDVTLLVTG